MGIIMFIIIIVLLFTRATKLIHNVYFFCVKFEIIAYVYVYIYIITNNIYTYLNKIAVSHNF